MQEIYLPEMLISNNCLMHQSFYMVINEKRLYPTSVGLTVLSEFKKIRLREEGNLLCIFKIRREFVPYSSNSFLFCAELEGTTFPSIRIDELEIDEELSRKE